jgi:L-ascorbate metabolism protein UlaG (beta-lactamase superfamily)
MNIQYYGHSCFKITTKPAGRATEDVNFFVDPFDKSVGLRPPQGQADAVFITHHHSDHNNAEALKGDPVIIDTPGEYAIKGMNVIGMDAFHDNSEGAERGHNTIFIFETEELKLCHLGDLDGNLTPHQMEMLEKIDVLFIPVGGKYTLDGKKAAELVRQIEPAIVIPMHYRINGSTFDVENEKKFCSEMGNCPAQKISKLTLTFVFEIFKKWNNNENFELKIKNT